MPEEIKILNHIDNSDDMWSGIGGHFDTFSQVICEFIDNSIANFIQHKLTTKVVKVTLSEDGEKVKVKIEDTGTGIKDLNRSFTLGGKVREENSHSLNEHGFGIKHALASADHAQGCLTYQNLTP